MDSNENNESTSIDDTLLDQLVAGNQDAFATCYEILMPQVYRFLRSRMPTNEDAEDLTEHVFLKVWKKRKSFDRSKSAFRTWVFVITKRSLIDWYRTRKVDAPLNEAVTKSSDENIEGEIDQEIQMKLVREALDKLDEKSSEVIRLSYLSQLTSREIAEILSISESAVRVRLHRGLKTLKEHLTNTYES